MRRGPGSGARVCGAAVVPARRLSSCPPPGTCRFKPATGGRTGPTAANTLRNVLPGRWRAPSRSMVRPGTWWPPRIQRPVEYLRFRATPEGRIYTLERQTGGQWRERLRLNASSQPHPNSVFAVRSKGVPYRHALGTFTDTLFAWRFDGLIMDEIRFGNGVGILGRRQSLVAGSSGDFLSGWDLVSAKLGERLVLASPAAGISLFAGERDLNLSARGVPNCSAPCYFVACGLVPGGDPPGTYKSCVPVRIGLDDPALAATARRQCAAGTDQRGDPACLLCRSRPSRRVDRQGLGLPTPRYGGIPGRPRGLQHPLSRTSLMLVS